LDCFGDSKVKKVAAGAEHSAALTGTVSLFPLPSSLFPLLSSLFPLPLPSSLLLTFPESGEIWMWGNGLRGQLTEITEGRDAWRPFKLPPINFRPPRATHEDSSDAAEPRIPVDGKEIPVSEFWEMAYDHEYCDVQCGAFVTNIGVRSVMKEKYRAIFEGKADSE
jgi:hypothetical protein